MLVFKVAKLICRKYLRGVAVAGLPEQIWRRCNGRPDPPFTPKRGENLHEATIVFLSHHHRYISTTDMSLREIVSKLKKKTKARPSQGRPDPERNEVGSGSVGLSNPSPQKNSQGGDVEGGGDTKPRARESDGS